FFISSFGTMFDSTALEFGLINTLHTGDGLTDAIACVLVPTLVQRLRNYIQYERNTAEESAAESMTWRERMVTWIYGRQDAIHTIEFKQFSSGRDGLYHCGDSEYLMHNYVLQKAFAVYLAKKLDLGTQRHGRYELIRAPNDESAIAKALAQNKSEIGLLQVGALPPLGQWVTLTDGIEFMHEESRYDPTLRARIQQERVLYHLRTRRPGGTKRVKAIVSKAFDEFRQIEARKDNAEDGRFMYIRSDDDNGNTDDPSKPLFFKRYALSDDKTFDSIFFDEKQQLLQLLTDFHHRSGKFAIDGFPYKLGLLLHGPPGTGKTSIIKAIAQMTGRHVVTISLSKIQTNQELMQSMFDLQFKVSDVDLPVAHKFSDIVFVMEDVDCASDVVAARGAEPEAEPLEPATTTEKLMMASLLNVLDGVVDTPGRIVIMSTNHPEKLDPALIRPGRVNKKLFLGHMSAKSLKEMLEYFFSATLTEAQVASLEGLQRQFTPADIEALCAEYDSVDEIIARLGCQPLRPALSDPVMDGHVAVDSMSAMAMPLPHHNTSPAAMGDPAASLTGHLFFDTLVLGLVAILLQIAMTPDVGDKLWTRLKMLGVRVGSGGFVVRELESSTMFSEFSVVSAGRGGDNARLLQKAVAIHIADLLQLCGKDVLYELLEKPLEQLTDKDMKQRSEDGNSTVWDQDKYEEITRLRVTTLPPEKVWVQVQPGIWFQREVKDDSDQGGDKSSKSKKVTITFRFRTNLPEGTRAIDELVHQAFTKYQALEIKRVEDDKTRYMFVQTLEQVNTASDDGASVKKTTALSYRRYPLSEEKSFKNLFFDDKEQLLHLLDNFMNGTGRFAIRGFPRKLGLLLHGPPGTGKTSLIKAVAQYTGRHVVTISLSKIKTNQELMDAIFDLRFKVRDMDSPMTMSFKDIVFVMEDIDAASTVVTKRGSDASDDSSTEAFEILQEYGSARFTPAEIEELCLEFDDFDGALKQLRKAQPRLTKPQDTPSIDMSVPGQPLSLESLAGMVLPIPTTAGDSSSEQSAHNLTGHLLFDSIIVGLCAFLLQICLSPDVGEKALAQLKHWLFGARKEQFVVREIVTTLRFNADGLTNTDSSDDDARNLQKAVFLHIADLLHLKGQDVRYEVLEKPAEELTDEDREDEDDWYYWAYSRFDDVKRLRVAALPPSGVWVLVKPGIWFQREITDNSDDNSEDKKRSPKEVTIKLRLRTDLPKGTLLIDELVQEAYAKFEELERQRVESDDTRYMFVQTLEQTRCSSDADVAIKAPVVAYRRYPLGEEKSFKNLFFKEKDALLHLLDNFKDSTGRFAIRGFPNKLGLLLHGPPGTGKTSLIKAVAQYTGRHIVTISLSKVKTNQELMDAVFDLRFKVQDMDSPMTMSFSDVVFVMEDIDAASTVVTKRKSDDANADAAGAGMAGKFRRVAVLEQHGSARFTPAEIEELCLEFEDVAGVLAQLQKVSERRHK
ncbi:TPA: hypothetical protein N0F65_006304, partial [Lagenidium giganteum]